MRSGRRGEGRLLAAVALAALALAGCEDDLHGPAPVAGRPYGYPLPPPPPSAYPAVAGPGFDAGAFAWSAGAGPGQLAGRVAYHAMNGERWTCAGQTIALIPATAYSGGRMRVLYGSDDHAVAPAAEVRNRNAAQPGVDYGRFVRTATCDLHDGFSFRGLPQGVYFLIARSRPRGHAVGPNEGVVIMQRVDISPGPTRIVVPQG